MAAMEIGISYQAVSKWPDDLPARICDRVIAAVARKRMPEIIGSDGMASAPASIATDPVVEFTKGPSDRVGEVARERSRPFARGQTHE